MQSAVGFLQCGKPNPDAQSDQGNAERPPPTLAHEPVVGR